MCIRDRNSCVSLRSLLLCATAIFVAPHSSAALSKASYLVLRPASSSIATYVYKKGLLDGDYSFSTAVGLFNTVVNVILLIAVNKVVAKMNDGKGCLLYTSG